MTDRAPTDARDETETDEAPRRHDDLSLALRAADMGWWEWDLPDGEIRWSQGHEDSHGGTDVPATYETYLATIHPDDRERLDAVIRDAIARRGSYETEFRTVWPDGSVHWVYGVGRCFTDADGTPARLAGVARLIDDQVAARDAIQDAEQRFRRLANVAPVLLWVSGADGRCTFVNESWLEYTGREFDEELGAGWEDVVHPDDLERALHVYTRAYAEQIPFEAEYRMRRHDGAYRWVLDRGRPLLDGDGRFTGYVGGCIDIHQRKAAEERARRTAETEALLDAVYRDAPVGLAFFDADLRYVRVNDALADIDGLPATDHVGRTLADVVPAVSDEIAGHLRQVLETGEPLLDVERSAALPHDPGKVRHWQVSYYRVTLEDGEPLGVATTVVEVTERQEAEEALRAQRDLYETLLRAQSEVGEAFLLVEDGRVAYANEAATTVLGVDPGELYALDSLLDLLPADERERILNRAERFLAGDLPDVEPGFETVVVNSAGLRVPVEVAAKPLLGPRGTKRIIVVARDITQRKRAELERERLLSAEQRARRALEAAHSRASFLARLSAVLERTLHLEDTLAEVVALLRDELADAVAVDIVRRDGRGFRRVGAAAVSGAPERPEEAPATRALPLVARGRHVGALVLGWITPDGGPEGDDLRHLGDVAQRLALWVDNAVLYAEREHIASTLQAGLLPPDLPEIPGVDIAARYLPASASLDVGGDFYDVFTSGENRWSLAVGDVCGKGAQAAAITALARYTLRGVTTAGPSTPSRGLAILNKALLAERPDRFLTAVKVDIEPPTGPGACAALCIASAGHPEPVVIRADRSVEAIDRHGPLLGVLSEGTWPETEVELRPGDVLVLMTDGVTEADRSAPLTTTTLGHMLARGLGAAPASADDIAGEIEAIARRRAGGVLQDDVAILILRVRDDEAC